MTIHFLDSTTAMQQFLDDLGDCDNQPPRLFVDLEGNNLSRHGTVSLITILLEPERDTYIIDVTTLGQRTFTTPGKDKRSLQTILESSQIIKVFFDVRNDNDALYSLYGIRLNGIEDIQLMELASRTSAKRNVNGLARCIQQDAEMGYEEKKRWHAVKENGKAMFDPARGGGYAVFDQRPLPEDMMSYCVQDVVFMPQLRRTYRQKLCDAWWKKIERETEARVELSRSPSFQGKGRHMACGPPSWLHWRPSRAERQSRTLLDDPPPRPSIARFSHPSSIEDRCTSTTNHDQDLVAMTRTLDLTENDDSSKRGVDDEGDGFDAFDHMSPELVSLEDDAP
ncbi:hypothetical protein CAC42_6899 [Sphaceloma murrayae]|uniref:3'-5' exonuclease domain-containing protein n=1 Tax=Sphaceloma murrayae TaxID=2082308 RepID=A0A2K1QGU1_9PEZI|nr:hypothetical protein CAC42_6899 [Sphaceloma murrayae]